MSQRDTGWIQLYCSSAQEVLDSILCAYRIAETAMLPVLVCAEGFLLSHTSEVLDVPGQDAVDAFIPALRPPEDWVLDPGRPRVVLGGAGAERLLRVPAQRRRGDGRRARRDRGGRRRSSPRASGARRSGRSSSAATPMRETALVAIGTIGDTARELLDDDDDLLVVRVHAYRPFPAGELTAALASRVLRLGDRPRARLRVARAARQRREVARAGAVRPPRTSSAGWAASTSRPRRSAGP